MVRCCNLLRRRSVIDLYEDAEAAAAVADDDDDDNCSVLALDEVAVN